MSDAIDHIEAVKARDARFRTLELGIEVEAGLREGNPLRILMERLRADADEAMTEFATANPADTAALIGLQARVFRFRYLEETLDAILARGRHAEASLTAEDTVEYDEPISERS